MAIELFLLLAGLGALVGILAGMLGIGGGLVIVPSLLLILPYAGVQPELVMYVALATSLATIIITSASSSLNHFKLGNVNFFVVKWLMPGVIVGAYAGANIAEWLPAEWLPSLFAVIMVGLSLQMLLSIKSASNKPLPVYWMMSLYGVLIGIVSSLAGIAGGSLSVPFLSKHGVEMKRAVGSSSVCGFFIAISGMLGFIINGVEQTNLPDYSLGYVYIPALIAISMTSMFTTRIGAKLATSLPTAQLKKIFAVFLFCVAGTMIISQ